MGAYAEYLAVKLATIVKKPSNLSFEEAASVPVASQTAWQGLFTHGRLEKGQTILIHGGAGAVGGYAVQFASDAGATVIATASGDDAAYLNSIGASRVIDYREAQFEKALQEKVDVVFDLIGGDTQERSFLVLKEGGHLVSATQPVSAEVAASHHVSGEMMRLAPSGDVLGRIARLLKRVRFDQTSRPCMHSRMRHRPGKTSPGTCHGFMERRPAAGIGQTHVTRQDRASCRLDIYRSHAALRKSLHHHWHRREHRPRSRADIRSRRRPSRRCDLTVDAAQATVDMVRAAGGTMVSLHPCHLTKPADRQPLVDFALDTFGRIDVLFNNAAMAYFNWIEDITDEEWDRDRREEVDLVFYLTRAAWPHLKTSHGVIVNTGSLNGLLSFKTLPSLAHTTAKAGVIAMTRQLAMEGREHGIRVNSISPGLIETNRRESS